MRKITKIVISLITILTVAMANIVPIYAVNWGAIDAAYKNTALQKVMTESAGWVPYGTGVLKISLPVLLNYYKGPAVFNPNSPSAYDEMKWVEGGGFDEARYAADYPDVVAVVGTSHNALWNHFKTQGVLEGRIAHYKCVFDGYTYLCEWQYSAVEAICLAQSCCNAAMSDYDKAVAVNNAMCGRFSYGYNGAENRNLAFTGAGICGDYARFYANAVSALGIPCAYVRVTNHAWNEVYIGGVWKIVDVTWNDTSGNQYLLIDSHPMAP